MKKKILFVFGTRPEVIKMAPVIYLAKRLKAKLNPVICTTAQHRYLLDQALAEFDIRPDIDLNLMKLRQSLEHIVSSVLSKMRNVYRRVRPELVLVQGDTSTVFAASLAAYYENIDVGHIEAGLRSGDNRNPFPEETNRRFVSVIARYNFCPTKKAKNNLLVEGVNPKTIYITGNTVVDALQITLQKINLKPPTISGFKEDFFKLPFALITGHRRENFGRGMDNVCKTIRSLAKRHQNIRWLWTVHLNPNARRIVFKTLSGLSNVKLIEPPAYSQFIYMMHRCKFIISDSGGVQEEAPSLGKKVLVTRICTERQEAVRLGTSILVGTEPDKISREVNILLKQKKPAKLKNPFGDGKAAKRIIDVIIKGSCDEFP